MDEIKKKVYLDIFATPGTLLPFAGGLTSLLASWAVGGDATLSFLGLAGVLAGFGVTATRLILGLDKITNNAYEHVVERQRREQEEALERLHQRLIDDQDSRTLNCLQDLRHLYSRLKDRVEQGTVNAAAYGVIERVDQIFHTSVRQLEESADLWETAQTLSGAARRSVLQQRETLVQEVSDTVVHLAQAVDRFHDMTTRRNRGNLTRLRKELDESIRVAKEVARRTDQLTETPADNPKEFE